MLSFACFHVIESEWLTSFFRFQQPTREQNIICFRRHDASYQPIWPISLPTVSVISQLDTHLSLMHHRPPPFSDICGAFRKSHSENFGIFHPLNYILKYIKLHDMKHESMSMSVGQWDDWGVSLPALTQSRVQEYINLVGEGVSYLNTDLSMPWKTIYGCIGKYRAFSTYALIFVPYSEKNNACRIK